MKPIASISLDLDNQWSYMKIHGDEGWDTFPTYLDIFVPYALEALDRLNIKITWFIVGQDAVLTKNHSALRQITEHHHEVGNHSFHHESWLHLYPTHQLEDEIARAEEAIEHATGQRPVGFRGPGFTWSRGLLQVLQNRGYLFDASTLPMFIGPLARYYYFWKSDLSREERKKRKELFGKFSEGFRPVRPYMWELPENRQMLEIPVTTMPMVKLPFHLSYLLYLSRYSTLLMDVYLMMAIYMCKMTSTSPSFLLHPLDLIGGDQLSDLAFFPGMDISSARKLKIFNKVVATLQRHFRLVDMSSHARYLMNSPLPSLRAPD